MISSPGIGSGLDINSIVSQLMLIEQQPLISLQAKKSNFDAQISSFGQVKSSLSNMQSAVEGLKDTADFSKYTATSSDEKVFTASASSTAPVTTNTIVITTLAAAHRLSSVAFTNSDTVVGTGTLTLSSGSNSFQLTIDNNNSTVTGIRDAINSAADNTGITATIVNVDAGSHLILAANKSGVSNAVQVTVSGDGDGNDTDANGLSRLVYQTSGTKNLTEKTAATDASFTIDGFTVTSASNQVTTAISGITLDLIKAGTATLTSVRDFSAVESSVSSLVANYNTLMGLISDLRANSLSGDSFLLGIENQIKNVFAEKVTGGLVNYPFDVGITVDKNGVMSFTSSDLSSKLASDLTGVTNFFTKTTDGFAVSLNSVIDSYVKAGGLIDGKTDGLNSSIDLIDDNILRLDERLLQREERLLAQYSALDVLMSSLTATSDFVTQQLTNLSILNNNNNNNN